MGILYWILRHLRLDNNNEIDLRFGALTMCLWSCAMSFVGGVWYATLRIPALCYLMALVCVGSAALYFYCRREGRHAYIVIYLFLCTSCVAIHFLITYYLGNCGTVFFVISAMLPPHLFSFIKLRYTLIVDAALFVAINITNLYGLYFTPVYTDIVSNSFRNTVGNMGLITFVFMLCINISSQYFIKATRHKLVYEASQAVVLDALTGLGNRRLLDKHCTELEEAVSEDFPLSVALLDIDSFKQINDTYGHVAGDTILVAIAQNMKDSFRKGDLLIRWGGEEFLIFLRRTAIRDAVFLMENFRVNRQKSPMVADDIPIEVNFTIGVKEHRPHTCLEDTIKRSDELMYLGKLRGGNCVMWEGK